MLLVYALLHPMNYAPNFYQNFYKDHMKIIIVSFYNYNIRGLSS